MPRVKKFRFTKRRIITFPSVKSPIISPVRNSPVEMNPASGHNGHNVEGEESTPEVATVVSASVPDLPKLCCVVCYNEYPYYTLNCAPWESAVTKDFYVALNIPEGDSSVSGLPFCPECHSKVAVMFSLHQQLQNVLQNFNCVRNDLAFTVVDSIGRNCRKGPLDLIRQQIHSRWKDLHAKAKSVRSSDVYDPVSTLAYLTPKLSVADEFPADPSTMAISGAAKERLGQLRRTPASLLGPGGGRGGGGNRNPSAPHPQRSSSIPTPSQHQNGKVSRSRTQSSSSTSAAASATTTRDKNSLGMPKLEPMAKIPLKSKSPIKIIPVSPRKGGLGFGQSRIGKGVGKLGGLVHHKTIATTAPTTGKTFRSKPPPPEAGSPSPQPSRFQLAMHFKPNPAYRKKAPRRLGNGLWKCNYCPATYENSVSVSQHESRTHPDTRPLLCNLCPKGFLTQDGVRKHLQAMHTEVVEGYVKCPHCPRHFAREIGYTHHISTMHRGKKIPNFDTELNLANSSARSASAPPPTPPTATATAATATKAEVEVEVVKIRKKGGRPRKKPLVDVDVVKNVKVETIPRPMVSPPSPEITDLETMPSRKHSSGGVAATTTPTKRQSPRATGVDSLPTTRTPGTRSGSVLGKRTRRSASRPPLPPPPLSAATPKKGREQKEEEDKEEKQEEDKASIGATGEKQEESKPEMKETETTIKPPTTEPAELESKPKEKEEEAEELPTKRRRRRTGATSTASSSPPPVLPLPTRNLTRTPKAGTKKEMMACNICGKTFLGPWALGGHAKSHRKGKVSLGGKGAFNFSPTATATATPTSEPEKEEEKESPAGPPLENMEETQKVLAPSPVSNGGGGGAVTPTENGTGGEGEESEIGGEGVANGVPEDKLKLDEKLDKDKDENDKAESDVVESGQKPENEKSSGSDGDNDMTTTPGGDDVGSTMILTVMLPSSSTEAEAE